MPGMGTMEAAPVFRVQRTEDWVVEDLGHASESFLCIGERRIHRDQGVVELPQRLHSRTILRHALFWGHPSGGKESHPGHIEGRKLIPQFRLASKGLSRF